MRLLTLLLMLCAGTAFAETASQAFARLPPLATTASANMDCSAAEVTDKKVRLALQPLSTAQVSYGGSAAQPTPAQIQAMAAMSSPEFNDCVSQLQTGVGDPWVQAQKDQLEAKLERVHGEYNKAYEAWCRAQPSEGCGNNPAIDKPFNAKAAAAGTQFLKDAQPLYAKQLKAVGDCIALREKGMGGATGGGNNAMDMLFASAAGMNWGLLNIPAAANTSLCEAAREAARKYLPQ
jgi:hypothetical protein